MIENLFSFLQLFDFSYHPILLSLVIIENILFTYIHFKEMGKSGRAKPFRALSWLNNKLRTRDFLNHKMYVCAFIEYYLYIINLLIFLNTFVLSLLRFFQIL